MKPFRDFLKSFRSTYWPKISRNILRGLQAVFGSGTWSAPNWLKWLARKLGPVFARARGWIVTTWRTRRLFAVGTLAAGLVVIGGGWWGYHWWENRPRPPVVHLKPSKLYPMEQYRGAQPDTLRIEANIAAARLDLVGKDITDKVKMSPAVKGRWEWASDRDLVFRPVDEWNPGQKIRLKFDPSIFRTGVDVLDLAFNIDTPEFTGRIDSFSFYKDPKNPKLKKLVATVRFSHSVDTQKLEKSVTLKMEGRLKRLAVTVQYNDTKTEAYIHSEPLEIPATDSRAQLEIAEGVTAALGGKGLDKRSSEATVPGVANYLRVSSVGAQLVNNEKYEPEQVLVAEITTGIAADEFQKNFEAWVLPQDRPATGKHEAKKNYRWTTGEVNQELLGQSEKLNVTPIPTDREFATVHSFHYDVPPGRSLFVRVRKGMKSYDGYALIDNYESVIRVPEYPEELAIMSKGSLLALSGQRTVSILARDIPAVQFEVARVLPSQVANMVSQTYGNFENPYFSNYSFNLDNMAERVKWERDLPKGGRRGVPHYVSVDFDDVQAKTQHGRHGLFFLEARAWDPVNKHALVKSDKRFVLLTNLGIYVKRSFDGSWDVFVQNIKSGQPVGGAEVKVIGANGLAVVTKATAGDGHVSVPNLKDFNRERRPVAWLVTQGEDLSFLPFDRSDRALNLSRFEVGGKYSNSTEKALDAYLFTDRGIYRPGDTMSMGLIVKPGNWKQPVTGVPLEIAILDPRGVTVRTKRITLPASGFDEWSYTTRPESPTGTYRVEVYVLKDDKRDVSLGSETFRVEEFLPDRLNILTTFNSQKTKGWMPSKGLEGRVALKNLYGTPAVDKRVTSELSVYSVEPTFDGFREYRFTNPLKESKGFTETLAEARTDTQGEVSLPLDLSKVEKGLYLVRVTASGYESESGRAVVGARTILVSDHERFVGYKADGDLNFIHRDSVRKLHLIAVSPDGTAAKVDTTAGLNLHWIEISHVSTLMRQPNGTYAYQSVERETEIKKDALTFPAQGKSVALPTTKAGDFACEVRTPEGDVLTRIPFTVVGDANLTRNLVRNSELQIKLNGRDFESGQMLEIEIRAPYAGAGLITIERENVRTWKWFKANATTSVQQIRIPEGLEGNGYVHVAMLRDSDSPEIYMSPLSVGVVPFTISRAKRTNRVDIIVPEKAKPGEVLKVGYKTERPGKIVVFGVDEGILQVARYHDPDPLGHFFQKHALEVTTYQILDLVMPEARLLRPSAPGGGEGGLLGAGLNPFRRKADPPVAFWSGILDSGPGQKIYEYRIPDTFNGTMRILAVVVSPESIGVATDKTVVQGPFVIQANAPVIAAPGDEFEVPVTIANLVEGSGPKAEVELEVTASDNLKLLSRAKQRIAVPETRDKVELLKFQAGDGLGNATIKILVRGAGANSEISARTTATLSIRPPSLYRAELRSGVVADDSAKVAFPRVLVAPYSKVEALASVSPLVLGKGISRWLVEYPFGCTEQLVSQAFPYLILKDDKSLLPPFKKPGAQWGEAQKPDGQKAKAWPFDDVMETLMGRQRSDGGFGYWTAGNVGHPWLDVYAAHFLLEATERGLNVPQEFLTRTLPRLRALATQSPATLEDARIAAYAIYVLSRNEEVMTTAISGLRQKLESRFQAKDEDWRKDLTAAYLASAYGLLKQDAEGSKLIRGVKADPKEGAPPFGRDYQWQDSLLYRQATLVYLMARHFPTLADARTPLVTEMMKSLAIQNQITTVSSATTLLALGEIGKASPSDVIEKLKVQATRADGKTEVLQVPPAFYKHFTAPFDTKGITLKNDEKTPVYWQALQTGFSAGVETKTVTNGLEVTRRFETPSGGDVKAVKVGDRMVVRILVRSLDGRAVPNVAISDLLPGGLEVVTDSIPRKFIYGVSDGSFRADEGRSTDYGDEGEGDYANEGVGDGEGEEASQIPSTTRAMGLEYVDVREDRVNLFGWVDGTGTDFTYEVRATNRGQFVIPPVSAEAMYDPEVRASSSGGQKLVIE